MTGLAGRRGASAAATGEPASALRLRHASAGELRELIASQGRGFGVREVRQALLNPFVDAQAIEEILALRHLVGLREVRSAVARHRRTPQAAALRLLPGLFWRDLLEVARDVKIAPAVRRIAEKYLIQRLPGLAIGEKIAIARRASDGLVAHLLHDPSPAVVRALLENPRLTEAALVPLAASRRALPRSLEILAASPRWGPRREIRTALSRNPQAPCRVILDILPGLDRRDLEAVAAVDEHSWIVRHHAAELLAAAGSRGHRSRPTTPRRDGRRYGLQSRSRSSGDGSSNP